MTRTTIARWICGATAAGLVALASTLPVWTMTMKAPQYPKGLVLSAYGTGMSGDIAELNILNHYIGMPPLQAPALETAAFPFAIAGLIALCLLSPIHRAIRVLAIASVALAPVAILADLQWRLYEFGHSLNPEAPIRLKPFTPLVVGTTTMGNFTSWGMASWGVWCLVAAAIALVAVEPLSRALAGKKTMPRAATAAAATVAMIVFAASGQPAAESTGLQALIDATPRGGALIVPPGNYSGPIVITGPLDVSAPQGATIDGRGQGSVVTLAGRGVRFRGFTVRNSGRDVTEEAAGVKATGDGHIIENNRIGDVYFGIHVGDGAGMTVRDNVIVPGEHHGARPGHGISAWHLRDSLLAGNQISHARDGIYLSFTNQVTVTDNRISDCRYGLHSMYSENAVFESNHATANLLGAALMTSNRLILRRNRITHHRDGPAAYGVLLKDIGDLTAEDNSILSNRIGVYAEAVPSDPARQAVLTRNLIAGNEVGLALQSTAALIVTGNRIAENLSDVRPLGRSLSSGMKWSRDGQGNSWGRYRGYDADRDGIGDQPFELDGAIDALLQRSAAIQAFLYTPAHLAIENAVRMFPVYRQPPVLVDGHPLMRNPAGDLR